MSFSELSATYTGFFAFNEVWGGNPVGSIIVAFKIQKDKVKVGKSAAAVG